MLSLSIRGRCIAELAKPVVTVAIELKGCPMIDQFRIFKSCLRARDDDCLGRRAASAQCMVEDCEKTG